MKRLEKDGSTGPTVYMVFDFQEDQASFHKLKLLLRYKVIVDDRLCVLGPEDLPSPTDDHNQSLTLVLSCTSRACFKEFLAPPTSISFGKRGCRYSGSPEDSPADSTRRCR